MPISSLLLKWTMLDWRDIAGFAALSALCGVMVFYAFLTDSPGKIHDPQNPIRMRQPYQPWNSETTSQKIVTLVSSSFHTVLPSLRVVLGSRVFWMLAAAHAGATMVKSSERILGTYYVDTSYGMATEGKAGAMTVFLPFGMLGGLLLGGRAFARAADEERAIDETKKYTDKSRNNGDTSAESLFIDATQIKPRNMIAFMYCLAICMSYMLSFLAMPFIRRALYLPEVVLILQVLVTMGLGAGVAVQYYHIPVIVGATYGHNRGLYQAYTDGVAALVSSVVWRIVGRAVEEGNAEGYGWAYGFAAVALLLILCGSLMVGIMEVYFVGGGWRHHLAHHDHRQDYEFPSELLRDLNGSWMEDEIMSTGLSLEDSSIKRRRGIQILSQGAIEFLSPKRPRQIAGNSLLTVVDSRDEEDESHGREVDLLGIDDDGSLLYPVNPSVRDTTIRKDSHSSLNDLGFNHQLAANDPFNSESNTDFPADYVSFTGLIREPRKCQITFTNSEDDESLIRETSVFDYPNSTVGDNNREVKTPSPIDSFSL
jgi:MFS family permease